MPKQKEFASVIIKYADGMIRFMPLEAHLMVISTRGISSRSDLAQHKVHIGNVDRFCEIVGKDNPAFIAIVDIRK